MFAEILQPSILSEFAGALDALGPNFFNQMIMTIGLLLTIAGGLYLAFIGWRAFKAACNKV